MITIFTIPRPFTGEFDHIQRNAIGSWLALKPQPEILLFGKEPGAAEAAAEFGVSLFPVERNEHGTPLVSSALVQAQKLASNDILVMANADNLYLSDFVPSVRQVARAFPRFLMIGQRWNIRLDKLIDFTTPDWEAEIRRRVAEGAGLHGKGAVDYLVFRDGGWWGEIPPFAVGRTTYDNYLVARTWTQSIPVVDATCAMMVVHQDHTLTNHGRGEEAHRNRDLHEQAGAGRGDVAHANWKLV
jgi:hypothetical protein